MTSLQNKVYNKGFTTLVSILIFNLILLSILVTSMTTTNLITQDTISYLAQIKATSYANTCAEIALKNIHYDYTYSGDETISIGDGTCYIESINLVTGAETITIEGYSHNVTKKVAIELNEVDSYVLEVQIHEIY